METINIGTVANDGTGDALRSAMAIINQNFLETAEKVNVLELDNTDAFTPTLDYHPATKKYVDDNAGGSGPFISPADYGAVGDGVADDTTAIESFFTALQAGAIGLMGKNKTYRITSYIEEVLTGDIVFDGNGSMIAMDFADLETLKATGNKSIVFLQTPAAVSHNLDANALKGETELTLDSVAGIEVGMGVYIPNGYWTDVNSALYKTALGVVTSINGLVVSIDNPLPTNFNVLYSATNGAPVTTQCVVQFSTYYDINIENCTFGGIGDPADATTTPWAWYGLRLNRAFYPRITNCVVHYGGRAAFAFHEVYGLVMDKCWNDKADVTVYGLYYNSLSNSVFKNCMFRAQTPAIVSDAAVAYGNVWDGCYAWSYDSYGFDNHGTINGRITNSKFNSFLMSSGEWNIENCKIYEVGDWATNTELVAIGSGNAEIRTRVTVDNCDFFPNPSAPNNNKFVSDTAATNANGKFDILAIRNSRFHSDKWLFSDRSPYIFENNLVLPDTSTNYYLPTSDYRKDDIVKKSYYVDFTNPATTTLDLGDIDFLTNGFTLMGEMKLTGAAASQVIWGSNNNQYMSLEVTSAGRARFRFREVTGSSYHDIQTTQTEMDLDSVWRNYAVTITPLTGSTATLKIFVNGRKIHTEAIAWSGFYTVLANTFRFGGQSGFAGDIASTLIFQRGITDQEVAFYSYDMNRGYESNAIGKWLGGKAALLWDDYTGSYDATVNAATSLITI